MTVFEYLNLRSEFEEITLNFKIPGNRKNGTLENMKWFIHEAFFRNNRYPLYERAREICKEIVEYEGTHVRYT